jgi:hypothetical protein
MDLEIVRIYAQNTRKCKEMIFDAAKTVLGYFGFDRTAYSNNKKGRLP